MLSICRRTQEALYPLKSLSQIHARSFVQPLLGSCLTARLPLGSDVLVDVLEGGFVEGGLFEAHVDAEVYDPHVARAARDV